MFSKYIFTLCTFMLLSNKFLLCCRIGRLKEQRKRTLFTNLNLIKALKQIECYATHCRTRTTHISIIRDTLRNFLPHSTYTLRNFLPDSTYTLRNFLPDSTYIRLTHLEIFFQIVLTYLEIFFQIVLTYDLHT